MSRTCHGVYVFTMKGRFCCDDFSFSLHCRFSSVRQTGWQGRHVCRLTLDNNPQFELCYYILLLLLAAYHFCSNARQVSHMCLSSCLLPSIFLVIFSLIALFNRRRNDASRTGWPMIMQWIVEALNECTNWELEDEPKTLIMAGWIYRWGQQHGIQQWNGHHISSVFVCWRGGG